MTRRVLTQRDIARRYQISRSDIPQMIIDNERNPQLNTLPPVWKKTAAGHARWILPTVEAWEQETGRIAAQRAAS